MKNDSASLVVSEEQICVCQYGLQDLIDLLLRQISLAKQGRIEQVEILAEKGSELVKQINDSGASKSPETGQLVKQTKELYRELFIILADRKSKTAQEIEDVRKGRRTIRTYRNGM